MTAKYSGEGGFRREIRTNGGAAGRDGRPRGGGIGGRKPVASTGMRREDGQNTAVAGGAIGTTRYDDRTCGHHSPDAMFNRTTLLILLVALATGAGLWAAGYVHGDRAAPAPQLAQVRLLSTPRELPPFSLRQSDRTQLVPGELHGHWTLVFVGFTYCPDVCPTTLAQLAQAQKQWEGLPESTRPRVLFVSVDPERDTVEKLGEYAHAFHRDTLAATADVPALERFTKPMSLVFAKRPLGDAPDQYTMDHSSAMVVLDPRGRMAGVITQPFEPKAIAADLIALTASGARP